MNDMIKNKPVQFPTLAKQGFTLSRPAKDIIIKLLSKDPKKRLGTKNDVNEVLSHPWFQSLDRDQILKK